MNLPVHVDYCLPNWAVSKKVLTYQVFCCGKTQPLSAMLRMLEQRLDCYAAGENLQNVAISLFPTQSAKTRNSPHQLELRCPSFTWLLFV